MLIDAYIAMPTEQQLARSKHLKDLDRCCAALAASNAYACEAGLAFDEHLKECKEGKHSPANVAWRVANQVHLVMRSMPGADHRAAAATLGIEDKRVLAQLDWCFA